MRIVLDYSPSATSTMLYINGAAQGDPMRGAEFFRALLRIWLGERPAEEELKRLLLRQEVNGKE
ncbi:MAG: chalcone isomerase family protein [Betaproteobacteria bacterium]|nr:chalcone isomerase family protein [Betaproteobacteria bacterium]